MVIQKSLILGECRTREKEGQSSNAHGGTGRYGILRTWPEQLKNCPRQREAYCLKKEKDFVTDRVGGPNQQTEEKTLVDFCWAKSGLHFRRLSYYLSSQDRKSRVAGLPRLEVPDLSCLGGNARQGERGLVKEKNNPKKTSCREKEKKKKLARPRQP